MSCGDSVVLVSFDVELVHQTLPFSSSTLNHATIIGKFCVWGKNTEKLHVLFKFCALKIHDMLYDRKSMRVID